MSAAWKQLRDLHPGDLVPSDLYVLDYGSTWFAKSIDSQLVRIEYNGGNRIPSVSITSASSRRTTGWSSRATMSTASVSTSA